MKRVRTIQKMVPVEVEEVVAEEGDVYSTLLNKEVIVFGLVYIYSGRVSTVNSSCIGLKNAVMVFATGSFSDKAWRDSQKLPVAEEIFIEYSNIEAIGELDEAHKSKNPGSP